MVRTVLLSQKKANFFQIIQLYISLGFKNVSRVHWPRPLAVQQYCWRKQYLTFCRLELQKTLWHLAHFCPQNFRAPNILRMKNVTFQKQHFFHFLFVRADDSFNSSKQQGRLLS
eukprot:UN01364